MYCENYLVAGRSMVDLRHPRPHYMDSAEDGIAILFPSLDTWERILDAVCFDAALVQGGKII